MIIELIIEYGLGIQRGCFVVEGDTEFVVDFHCHYAGPEWPALPPVNSLPEHVARWMGIARRIADLDGLIRDQQEAGVDLRVLSAPPALVTPDGAHLQISAMQAMNDHLGEVVARSAHLAGLATIDAYQGEASAAEVERVSRELELPGIVVDCAHGDLFLDAPQARATLQVAADLGLAVFAHPVSPKELSAELAPLGNWGRMLARGTSSAASLLALVNSGVLDEVDGLQIVFAWLGGGGLVVAGTLPGAERLRQTAPPDERWHVYFDTMGFEPSSLRYAVDLLGSDHVLVGSDWPIGLNVASRTRVHETLDHAGLEGADRQMVSCDNALRLLGRARSPIAS
ncbi:MAG TPA: amidohydrolase family protein [Acidimicrobiales bacterium]|nr:amidohydrolase family protein [Acidimicrobiales bacterium]